MTALRRLALTLVMVTVLVTGAAGSAPAAQSMIGPECRPSVVAAVLDALARNGTPVVPGQQVQYLQVSQHADGTYYLELCFVTVPGPVHEVTHGRRQGTLPPGRPEHRTAAPLLDQGGRPGEVGGETAPVDQPVPPPDEIHEPGDGETHRHPLVL